MNKRHQESYENAKISYIYKEKFRNKCLKDKKYCKARDYQLENGRTYMCCSQHMQFEIQCTLKIPIVFDKGSNYDYHFIIKVLAEEFKKQFTYFGEKYLKTYNLHSFNKKRS